MAVMHVDNMVGKLSLYYYSSSVRLSTSWTDIGCAQLPATLLILHALRHSEIFVLQGWQVGASWILATASYSIMFLAAVVVGVLGKFSPNEYSLIPNLDNGNT
jgi:hypothetical protein